MTYKLRPWTLEDITAIAALEQAVFSLPWSSAALEQEFTDNPLAHYLVVEHNNGQLLGYAGMWIVLDEAHIMNIAITPAWQGQGLGKVLLQTMIARAIAQGAIRMTLEVRLSNQTARGLYQQLGFIAAGVRPGYYTDNNEDALLLWLDMKSESA